jgi:hypothetical protein
MMEHDITDRTPITVRRTNEATTYVKGLAQVTTDVDEFCIQDVSVQPMVARERQVLPELIRDSELLKLYTKCTLQSVDVEGKKRADRIDYKGQEYVVQSVEDWFEHGGFYKVIAVKEDD